MRLTINQISRLAYSVLFRYRCYSYQSELDNTTPTPFNENSLESILSEIENYNPFPWFSRDGMNDQEFSSVFQMVKNQLNRRWQ